MGSADRRLRHNPGEAGVRLLRRVERPIKAHTPHPAPKTPPAHRSHKIVVSEADGQGGGRANPGCAQEEPCRAARLGQSTNLAVEDADPLHENLIRSSPPSQLSR